MTESKLDKTWAATERAAIDSAHKMRGAEDAAWRMKSKLGATIDEGLSTSADAAREGLEKVGDGLEHLKDRLNAKAGQAARALDGATKDSAKTLRRTRKSVAATVAGKPIEALLLAGVVGYLIGYSISSRS
jgi:hypothetical protein